MSKATFRTRKPGNNEGMSASQLRDLFNSLYQGDNASLRPRCSMKLEEFEYPTDAAIQAEWSGTGVTVTSESTIIQDGSYAMKCVIDGTDGREVTDTISTLDISDFAELMTWNRCSVISSAIQLLLRDSAGNESYWNITTHGTADTWKQETLDLTTPDANNGTNATLSDIVRIGYKGLDASATYYFDLIYVRTALKVYVSPSSVESFFENVWLTATAPLSFAGGVSPTIAAPAANPRIDLLTINSAGTLALTAGAEAASPSEPSCPAGVYPICFIYCKTTQVKIVDYEDKDDYATDGYIYKDIRTSAVSVSSGFPSGAVQGDVLYYNGTNWVRLAPGTSGKLLKTKGAAANPAWELPADLAMASQAQGTILYFDGTNWVVLAPGTSGHYLKTQGAAANPLWAAVSAGGDTFNFIDPRNEVIGLANSGNVAWTDLDLSSYVPSGTKAVLLGMQVRNTTANEYCFFAARKNGSTDSDDRMGVRTPDELGGASMAIQNNGICAVDANRVIEYRVFVESASTVYATMSLLGYLN